MYSQLQRAVWYALGVMAMLFSVEGHLLATVSVVPELNATSLTSGLALLSAGVLMIRARQRSK
jgi:hypothetical protein